MAIQDKPSKFHNGIETDTIGAIGDTVTVNDMFVYPDKIQQLETIAELEAYTGESTTVFVKDTLRGGIFNYVDSGLTTDNAVVFNAANGGFWKRHLSPLIGRLQCLADLYPSDRKYGSAVTSNGNGQNVVVDKDGNLYVGIVSNSGVAKIIKYTPCGDIYEVVLKQVPADTHNSPSMLLDERSDAEFPIIAFLSTHNASDISYWRFPSLDIESIDLPTEQFLGYGPSSYSYVYRYNEDIFLFTRAATASASDWVCAYSSDNGDSFDSRIVFSTTATDWSYLSSEKIEGTNTVIIGFLGHVDNATNRDAYVLKLDLASGEVDNFTTVVEDDFRDYIVNGVGYIDPYLQGNMIYDAPPGESTNTLRFSKHLYGNRILTALIRKDEKEVWGMRINPDGSVNGDKVLDTTVDGEFFEYIFFDGNRDLITMKWNPYYSFLNSNNYWENI